MAILRLAVLSVVLSPMTANGTVRITNDPGGKIGTYYSYYTALRDSGQDVIIDGRCSSACTMVLGIVPYDHICVTTRAVLGFHAAWRSAFLGFKTINEPGTRTLWTLYPLPVRQWISQNGGLGLQMIYLSGPRLFAMYRICR